jgi:hypothetical protein
MHRTFWAPILFIALVSCSNGSQPSTAITAAMPDANGTERDPDPAPVHGNHDPHHGGVVYMKDDLHFEVVLNRSGKHRVYFSDASRAELPASIASQVSLSFSGGEGSAEVVEGEIDESGESWIVSGPPMKAADLTVRVGFVIDAAPYWIDAPFIEAAAGSEP